MGVIASEEAFYEILLEKWKEYLHRLSSGRHLEKILRKGLETVEDIRENMEAIKQYLRGHNLYDIFYGKYREQETKLLTRYLELAPREDFQDILDAIDRFLYFESRKCSRKADEGMTME